MKNGFAIIVVSFIVSVIFVISPQNVSGENKSSVTSDRAFEFALIGDTPYDGLIGKNTESFARLVSDINVHSELKWIMFAGDMKSGVAPCSDELYQDRFKRFNQFNKPFIMTLGDNEWTDCHRVSAGGHHPLERLAKVREIFFSVPGKSLGKNTMWLETQAHVPGYAEFPENVRWIYNDVVFAVMHVVGSNNGLEDFESISPAKRSDADNEEVARRNYAVITWMKESFAMAENHNAAGIFLMIHANPGFDFFVLQRDGYEEFLKSLDKLTRKFSKPVVLAHGDTHRYRVDRPSLTSESAPDNFTRVETFGEDDSHWINVIVNPDDENVFRFEKQRVP